MHHLKYFLCLNTLSPEHCFTESSDLLWCVNLSSLLMLDTVGTMHTAAPPPHDNTVFSLLFQWFVRHPSGCCSASPYILVIYLSNLQLVFGLVGLG